MILGADGAVLVLGSSGKSAGSFFYTICFPRPGMTGIGRGHDGVLWKESVRINAILLYIWVLASAAEARMCKGVAFWPQY